MVSTLRAIASVAALFFLGCSSALSNAPGRATLDHPEHDTFIGVLMDVAPLGTDLGGGRSAAQVFPAIAAAFLGR